MTRKFLTAAALACATLAAPLAAAQTTAPDVTLFVVDESCTVTSATQDRDQAIVERAITAANQRGYAGLSEHLRALRGVVDRAPACYPEISRRGEVILVRGEMDRALILGMLLQAAADNQNRSVEVLPNTYPVALLMLASYDVENRRYEQAIAWLDRGLALQPNNQDLAFEKVAAYQGLRHYQDGR